ncbi:hypothetical protein BKA82DRAFT_245037 [Pisolithus tinctorius]|uniref:Uncharacterized protein n=1 Tax=Pisolithus tinctorius Marx 270 TaxID=870435 RepID=A0A0C3JFR7_PISTI|nr:hypothetical protein BKA82DRAFT_245037 [Pisolithus tinctorius]KIN96466.1 hypothetical protein M404DRAFT_245037 [Pisolithus tinctorius Marx 270]
MLLPPVTSTDRTETDMYPDIDNAAHSNNASQFRDVLTTPFFIRSVEWRTLHRQYDELRKLVVKRMGKGKKLGGSEQKMIQKVGNEAQLKDATSPSDLRVLGTAVRIGAENRFQIAIGGGSNHDPTQGGDDNLGAEITRLSEEEANEH